MKLVDFGWEEITPGSSEGNPGLVLSASAGFASETGVVHKCGTPRNKVIPQQIGTVGLTVDVEPTADNIIPDNTVE